jgi:hypothetical protein
MIQTYWLVAQVACGECGTPIAPEFAVCEPCVEWLILEKRSA